MFAVAQDTRIERAGDVTFPDPALSPLGTTTTPPKSDDDDDDGDDDEAAMPPARVPLWKLSRPAAEASGNAAAAPLAASWRRCGEGVLFAAYESLTASDAVALLSGVDNTGLMLWRSGGVLASMIVREPRGVLLGGHSAHDAADGAEGTTSVCVFELGCGAAPVSCAAAASLAKVPHAAVIATDGNPECVALAAENIRRNLPSADDRFTAAIYSWGGELPGAVLRWISDCPPRGSRLLHVVAGDVVYNADAVPLIAAALASVVRAASAEGRSFELWFTALIYARAWTVEASAALADGLEAAVKAAGWRPADKSGLAVPPDDGKAPGTVLRFQRVVGRSP